MRSAFEIPVDIQSMNFTRGKQDYVLATQPAQIGSKVWFVAPISPQSFKPRTYKVVTHLGDARVRFFIVENEREDLISQASKDLVLVADEKGKPFFPRAS